VTLVGWIVVLVVVPLGLYLAISSARDKRLREARGYWVEYLSPGRLRAGQDDIAVVYHEPDLAVYFSGRQRPRPARTLLEIPSPSAWSSKVPEGRRERRDVILARVLADGLVKRCEVVESDSASVHVGRA